MYHVKEYPYPVPGNLDLQIADEEEFSPDKLRSNVERLYMTVVSAPGLCGELFVAALITKDNWLDGIRQAHHASAIMAGDTADDFVLHCLLSGLVP
jgi:hypothetical protein